MKCINCPGQKAATILVEIFPCNHCNGEIKVEYNVCNGCGTAWKTMGGELVPGMAFFDVGLGNFFDDEELFNALELDHYDSNKDKSYMSDYVHKCLRCHSIAYEVKEGLYKCKECDFEWEIIKGV